jgi:DNA-directed RNA polymerase specialized sigma24 family protein
VDFDPVMSLSRDWQLLVCGPLPARLRAWAVEEPALAPFAGEPARLIAFLRGPAGAAAKDELLQALVRIAAEESLAARVVLHALMPGLKRIAGRVLLDLSERDELWALLLAHAWERIRRYPLARRPQRIAANILLDTLRRTTRELERERRRRHRSVTGEASHCPSSDQRAEATRILLDATSTGAISQLEARIIFAIRVERCSLADAAAEEGLPYNVLRVRLQRAERRLLLHLGYTAVPNRRSRGPFSSARVDGPTEASRIDPAPHVEESTTRDIGWLSGADDA